MIDFCDLAPGYVRAIAPYQPGKPISELAREMGLAESVIVKLASNENPLGASPRAREAMLRALGDIARYPDGNGFELKAALSRRYRVDSKAIVLGNGSNDVLEMVARAFLAPGLEAVYSQHAFAVYPLAIQAVGAQGVEVPARDYGHDPQALLEAVTPRTRLIFIANPNNPTGTLIPPGELYAFLQKIPEAVLVVLDQAYHEYLPDTLKGDSMDWLQAFPNLVVTRTFSKIYGLAGLRVGYALAHPSVAEMMNRVRQPFNVNSVAQAAAIAALEDEDFVKRSFELNQAGMDQLERGFERLGLDYIPSYGNFITFRVGDAQAVYRKLLKQGVIVRPIANYGMPEHLRVTVGLPEENVRFLEVLEQALGA